MNLVLLEAADFTADNRVCLTGRRFEHIKTVHKANPGDTLIVGLLNGNMGSGEITRLDDTEVHLKVSLDLPPPPPLPVILVLALPRPKVLRRLIKTVAELGIKKLYLVNSYRVEKSYWKSPALLDETIRENLVLGLEQAKDTMLPEVCLRPRFKPFVEDELPTIIGSSAALIAHPKTRTPCPQPLNKPATVIIGPEGGFIPYEIERLEQAGGQAVQMGPRILRVETAVPALIGKLFSDHGVRAT
jgi:RsmE family RNA methyltransferase